MKATSIFAYIIISLCIIQSGIAQVDTTGIQSEATQQNVNEALQNEEVEVIKAFKAKLAQADALSVKPSLPAVKKVDRKYQYDFSIIPYDIQYADPEIKPFAMKAELPEDNYDAYAKLGFGNYTSPLADISYTKNLDNAHFGLQGKYFALDNSSNNPYQKMQDIDARIFAGLQVSDMLHLDINTFASLDKRYLYHIPINKINEISESEAERKINNYGLQLKLKNASQYALQYAVGLSGDLLDLSNVDARELNLGTDAEVSYAGETWGAKLTAKGMLSDLSEIADTSYLTLQAAPSFFYQKDKLRFSLGGHLAHSNDSLHIFPQTELMYDLLNNKMQLTLGTGQELIHNSLANTLRHNPYYEYKSDDYKSTIRQKYFIGLQGQWANVTYRSELGYQQLHNQVYYLATANDARKYAQHHLDTKGVYIHASGSYTINEVYTVGASIQQYFYDLDDNEKLYHVPSLRLKAYADIGLLENKLRVKPSLSLTDKIDYIDLDGNAQKLDNMLNLSAEAEYRIHNNFKVFAEVKNIFDNNYAEYFGYDDVGIHAHGGVKIKF